MSIKVGKRNIYLLMMGDVRNLYILKECVYVYILTHLCERDKRGIELLVLLSVTHFFF